MSYNDKPIVEGLSPLAYAILLILVLAACSYVEYEYNKGIMKDAIREVQQEKSKP